MDKKIINPHDKFFKSIFSQPDEAKEFLEKTAPKAIVNKLNFTTFQLDTTNYVDDELQEFFADIVYNCNYKVSKDQTIDIKITFLFEHKSYKVHVPHLQLIRYMLNIWDVQFRQAVDNKVKAKDFHLQPIIPIIFYHGKEKWDKQAFEQYFSGMDNHLLQFVPKFDYHFINTVDYSNETIKQLFVQKQLKIALLLMKNIFNDIALVELIKDIYANSQGFTDKEQEQKFYEKTSNYIFYTTNNKSRNKIITIMETLQTHYSQDFVSMADGLILEGMEKGLEKGLERGMEQGLEKGMEKEKERVAFSMLKKEYSDAIILEITGISKLQLDCLKTLLKK